jgi:hypothetical protein
MLKWFDGTKVDALGAVLLDLECAGQTYCVECVVVENLDTPVLLGRDFIYKAGLTIDFGEGSYWVQQKPIIKWPLLNHQSTVKTGPSSTDAGPTINISPRGDVGSTLISPAERLKEIAKIRSEYPDVLTDVIGHTDVIEHEIELLVGTKPVKQKPYRLSPAKEKSVREQIPEMLSQGVIEESKSPWRSPVVMVPKANTSAFRMCVDFRRLNAYTKFDAYPMKPLEHIMADFKGAKIFSVIDLKSGYWQVKLREQDRELTGFSVGDNLYQFRVLPFGVKNGCATFQRLMEKVLKKHECLGRCCKVEIDDIIVYSMTVEEHLLHLREVFDCLRESGLTASITKTRLFLESVRYLGVGVSGRGFSTDHVKVQAIVDYPPPRNCKELDRFLGMCGWFLKFIPGYSTVAEPLFHLRRKNTEWCWNKECQLAFQTLKNK